MATATKTETVTLTLVLTGEEAEEVRRYLGKRSDDALNQKGVAVTDHVYVVLRNALAPF